MSSYFDKASRMFTDAMKNRTEAEAEKIVETVVNTYGTYLTFISKRLSVASRPAFEPLKERWLKLISRPLVDDRDRDMFLSLLIERIHDFARQRFWSLVLRLHAVTTFYTKSTPIIMSTLG